MRRIFTLSLLFASLYSFSQDGELDPNYGTDGKQINAVTPPVNNNRERIVVLSDGSFLQCYAAGNDFGLAKFQADGSPDAGFGADGVVTTDFGGNDAATALSVRPDGKIVVVGYTNTVGTDNQFAIARYNADGSPDLTFDVDGKRTIVIGSNDVAYSVISTGTSAIIAGSSYNSATTNFEFALAKVLDDGTLDASFSGDGKQTTVIGAVANIYDLDIEAGTQKIVAVGYSKDVFNVTRMALARYTNLGVLDATFDGDGIVTVGPFGAGNNDVANSVQIQPSTGKIVVGGQSANATDFDFAVARFLNNGTLDNTLEGDGHLSTSFSSSNDIAYSVSMQVDGKIIVAGTSGGLSNGDFLIARYTDLGLLDNTFNQSGTPGYNQIDFGTGTNDTGYDVGFQGTNLLFGGVSGVSLASARLINSVLPLPFFLLNFTASQEGVAVLLKWQTASEIETSRFEILRSADGKSFSKIGELKAAGSSVVTKNYSFTDERSLPSVSYYRLRMVNKDGSVSYSRILVIRSDLDSLLVAFPNPVRNVLNVQINLPAGAVRMQLFDLGGRTVKAMQLRSTGTVMSTTIDLSGLPSGTYFLRMNDQLTKIIKQ